MRYVNARIEEYDRDEVYRIYVARSLQLAPQGKYVTLSYSEMLESEQTEVKSGDEIVNDIILRAGLVFGE